MSKVTMPDPLAWMFDEANQIGSLSTRLCWARHSVPPSYGQNHKGLVTVDQAESYAAAKAREALEEAAKVCDAYFNEITEPRSNPYYDGALDAADILEQRIRALIPSTPA